MSITHSPANATVVKATAEQMTTVIDIVAQAFDDDPAVNWFVRQDHRRSAAVHEFFRMLATVLYTQQDENYLMSDRTGATMWLPPGVSTRVGFWENLGQLPAAVRIARWEGLPRMLKIQSLLECNHPSERHYYLFAIGTLPEIRGRGIGSKLMRPMIERMDREGVPAYLENSKQQNLPFYQRHGFEVVKTVQLPGDGPKMWLMWREPRSKTATTP